MITELVKKYDPQNQFDVLRNSYSQIEYAWNNKIDLKETDVSKIENIVISGLGGSAISGDLMSNYLREDIKYPLFVNRGYSLPHFASEKTLVIISSYSGNTEETVEVLQDALKRRCRIVCLTTGGKIGTIAKENNLPIVNLKPGFQPRYALGLSFFCLLKVLSLLGLIPDQNENVTRIIADWKLKGEEYSKENNYPFRLAENLVGFIPVIYSVSGYNDSVGNRFKCQLNENSKVHAFHNVYSELNHNEIVGWETQNNNLLAAKLVTIRDEVYHPQIKKRIEFTSRIIEAKRVETITVSGEHTTFQLRLLELIYLLDWVSYYLAVIRGKDPSEIDNILKLKEVLS
ncbi:MAG: bifunctional phosphoglucose/phosphomannose isomerase [Ignavibacteriaceae bacterium]